MSRPDLAGASIDFVRVGSISYADCYESEQRRNLDINVFLVGADAPVVTRRPGASLANPNKAARRVTAVEFASDSDDA